MADIMTSIGLDINDFKGAVNQLQESTAKLKTGVQGNMLAMSAGILGVGSVIYSFAEKSNADFDRLKESSANLSKEFSKLSATSGFDALNSAMGQTIKLTDELAAAEAKSAEARRDIKVAYWEGLKLLFQGKGLGDREKEISEAIIAATKEKGRLQQLALAGSKAEVAMSELKLTGTKDEIELAERKLKLAKELDKIDGSAHQDAVKDRLKEDAQQIAANEAQLDANKKQSEQEEHNRKQKEDFLKFQSDEQKKIEDKAKQDAADALSANREMQAAEQALIDKESEKLSLKTQAQLQSKKVSDAEFNLSKAAKGTAEFYERQAELARERLKLENLLSARAKAYEKGQLSGRRFDREQEKARKKEEQGRARLGRQIARENKQPVPQRPAGVGGPIAPRPMMQPQAAQPAAAGVNGKAAGNVMTVETLNVKVLKSQ